MLDFILLFLVLAVNTGISVWNCYAVGRSWAVIKEHGSIMHKVVLWSGAIQSAIGFSMVLLFVFGFVAGLILTAGEDPVLTEADSREMFKQASQLWYVLVIFPALGSGTVLWLDSVRTFIRTRKGEDALIAAWNTYAMVRNVIRARSALGTAFQGAGKLLKTASGGRGSAKGKAAIFMIMLVVVAIAGGILIAWGLIRFFADRTALEVQEATGGIPQRNADDQTVETDHSTIPRTGG